MRDSLGADAPSLVRTHTQSFPDLMLEAVRDSDNPKQLLLHSWDGKKTATQRTIGYKGLTYAPLAVTGLVQGVRFPSKGKSFGSEAKLVAEMTTFLARYSAVSGDAAAVLTAFVLASWFVDCLQVAPVLDLIGPEYEVNTVLRLLGCLCRRPILLGDVDVAALATLPAEFGATLLISQRKLSRRYLP